MLTMLCRLYTKRPFCIHQHAFCRCCLHESQNTDGSPLSYHRILHMEENSATQLKALPARSRRSKALIYGQSIDVIIVRRMLRPRRTTSPGPHLVDCRTVDSGQSVTTVVGLSHCRWLRAAHMALHWCRRSAASSIYRHGCQFVTQAVRLSTVTNSWARTAGVHFAPCIPSSCLHGATALGPSANTANEDLLRGVSSKRTLNGHSGVLG